MSRSNLSKRRTMKRRTNLSKRRTMKRRTNLSKRRTMKRRTNLSKRRTMKRTMKRNMKRSNKRKTMKIKYGGAIKQGDVDSQGNPWTEIRRRSFLNMITKYQANPTEYLRRVLVLNGMGEDEAGAVPEEQLLEVIIQMELGMGLY